MKHISGLNLIALTLLGASVARPAAEQPVFIYLHSRIADHVNVEVSEDQDQIVRITASGLRRLE